MGNLGSTPIHKAAKEGDLTNLYVAVQQFGSQINVQEKELGYTALHVAAWQGYDAIVRELLTRGADPNILDKESRTALHLAAQKGHTEVVRALLRANCLKDLRDRLNHTAYDYAFTKYPDVAALIGPPADLPPDVTPPSDTGYSIDPNAYSIAPPTTTAPTTTTPPNEPVNYDSLAAMTAGYSVAPAVYPNLPAEAPQYAAAWQKDAAGVAQPVVPSSGSATAPTGPIGYVQQSVEGALAAQGKLGAYQGGYTPGAYTPAGGAVTGGVFTAPPPLTTGGPSAGAAPGGPAPPTTPATPAATTPAGAPAAPAAAKPQGPLGGLKSAADLAMQQLAKLNVKPPGDQSGKPQGPNPLNMVAGVAGAVAGAAGGLAGAVAKQLGKKEEVTPYSGPPGRQYHPGDIAAATENFAAHNKIGQGGFGAVYKGVLDGVPVAVKVMDTSHHANQGLKEFTKEVTILTRLHHPHVVLLIGSCAEKGLLVYELMEGGSLEERLFGDDPSQPPLSWQDRVRIAAEVASALLYLHSAPEPIVHMDLKPANILLDRTLRAKLGDVGLARLMGGPVGAPLSTTAPSTAQDDQLVGTPAYVDPEYLRSGQFSPKSDVYALGMVMLQLLTGLEQSNVVSTVEEARRNPLQFEYVLDKKAGSWPAPEAMPFADIALKCVEFRRTARPDLRTEILPALLQLKQRTTLYPAAPTPAPAPATPAPAAPAPPRAAPAPNNDGAPAMFICPITQEIMYDPVVAADGYTYEREAIEAWMTRAHTSPMTNLPLTSTATVPNMNLRSSIKEWMSQRPRVPQYAHA